MLQSDYLIGEGGLRIERIRVILLQLHPGRLFRHSRNRSEFLDAAVQRHRLQYVKILCPFSLTTSLNS